MSHNKMYNTLEDIKHDNLVIKVMQNIMSDIKDQKIIYQNEEQFQFDLAWRINKHINENSGIQVLLECFSMTDEKMDNKNSRKKFFTDIILLDEKGCFIPIELKYKKKGIKTEIGTKKQKVVIGNDGAADLGKFDYLWDIHRIEQLRDKSKTEHLQDKRLVSFVRGYAIMITNDDSYWKTKKGSCADLMTLNKAIKEIKWNSVYDKKKGWIQAESICKETEKNYNKYFIPLTQECEGKRDIDKKYLGLKDEYDFNKSPENKNIITVDNYECKNYKDKQITTTIKAFIATIK